MPAQEQGDRRRDGDRPPVPRGSGGQAWTCRSPDPYVPQSVIRLSSLFQPRDRAGLMGISVPSPCVLPALLPRSPRGPEGAELVSSRPHV